MKPQVTFYDVHAQGRWPLIARLVEAAWAKRRRMLVHCDHPTVARELDNYLWVFRDDAFVPHEVLKSDGSPLVDPECRILISVGERPDIEASILVQEMPATLDFAMSFQHVIDIVDHRSDELLNASRARFKAWREREIAPQFRRNR